MGKKAKLYAIVLINLLAWGYVGYKVYGALQGDEDVPFTSNNMPVKKIDDVVTEEKLDLSLNYPDPFLKNGNFSTGRNTNNASSSSSPKTNQAKSAPAVIKPVVSATVAPALNVRYLGLLKNNDKGTQTAMLNVNDRSVFAKLNDVIEGYTIIEVNKDAIRIKKGKEILTVSK